MSETKQNQTQSSDAKPKKGTLMIVEDDPLLLKVFERFFAKHYNLITSTSGNEAIEKIKDGAKPEVILSDQRMPGISGSEFLSMTIPILPDSIRVIITAHSDPKEIIACINQAHTYMFLTKPIEEMELIQAVKLCFTHYYTIKKNKKLLQELKDKNALELKAMQAPKESPSETTLQENLFLDFCKSHATYQNVFFRSFNNTIIPIIHSLAESMKLSATQTKKIEKAAIVYSLVMSEMPDKYQVIDIENLPNEDEVVLFLEYYLKNLEKLTKYAFLRETSQILMQIYERFDGTGFPNNLSGKSISTEAQVLSIATLYMNNVFRVPADLYIDRNSIKEFVQTLAVTTHRHKAVTKYFFDRTKWFNPDIFNHFRYLLQDKTADAMHYERKDFSIPNKDFDPEYASIIAEQKLKKEKVDDSVIEETSDGVRMKEQTIRISELKSGMMVAHSIVTKTGILVVKQETTITPALLKNIRHLDNTGQLKLQEVDILLPIDDN